ncbi:MAG: hypothetical protein HUU18_05205 [Phycisphaerales bacterium]|nr:hypothetical protein [Phycisphaerales bacterium]
MAKEYLTHHERANRLARDHDRLSGGDGNVAARFGPAPLGTVRVRKGNEAPVIVNQTDLAEWTAKGYAVVE